MTRIYLLRHAQTYFNGIKTMLNTFLDDKASRSVKEYFLSQRSPELQQKFKFYTGSDLPEDLSRAAQEFYQNNLTAFGQKQATDIAKYLSLKDCLFLTSPSMRAIQTAYILANSMGIPSTDIMIDQPHEFLEEINNPNETDVKLFLAAFEGYLKLSQSLLNNRPLVVVTHGNILKAVHNHLSSDNPLDYYSNCGLTIAEFNPHLRIIQSHRRIEDLIK